MKRSCTLSHPSHQTLKTLHGCLLILCFTWEVTKKLYSSTTSALLDSAQWQSTEPKPGDTVHSFSEKHTHVQVKIKAPFLMHLPLGFLLFLLLILHRCDSLSGIPSWISHHQQSDDYVFNPSSFIVMMTRSFPFLDFALLFSHFNTSLSTFA